MASSKPRIIAEYAKSSRSSCKKCTQQIVGKALRLGSVTKDPSGRFDLTKWYHLNCFNDKIDSVESIGGFDSLKNDDQEDMKKLSGKKPVTAGSPRSGSKRTKEYSEDIEKERDSKKAKNDYQEDLKKLVSSGEKVVAAGSPRSGSKEERNSKKSKFEMAFSRADVKDTYKDAELSPKWKAFQTVLFLERDDGLHDSSKIAAFDFDGCLAETSVKRKGADAWKLMYPSKIPDKLQGLYKDGYKLVIFTNESNIDRWKNKRQEAVDSKIGRLNNFIKKVEVPIQVFIACAQGNNSEDLFRKPKPGMWHLMEKHLNSGIPVDMDQSFYVGDAAGREKDHSDADIKFAQAVGLKFYLPEEYFL